MVLAMAVAVLAGRSFADDVKLPQNQEEFAKLMAEAGKPGPEHAKLEPLAGSWTYTCKFWLDPTKPPAESKGTVERKWILGGRFLEEKVVGTNFDGKPGFEGVGLVGYDNGQKKYTSNWICSMGTGACTGLGVADPSGTKLTFQTESFCPIQKKIVKGRDEIRIESSDRTVAESYMIEDGKEVKMMELVCVRKR
jgi:hypothetical protein